MRCLSDLSTDLSRAGWLGCVVAYVELMGG